jgi:hypothetical protein
MAKSRQPAGRPPTAGPGRPKAAASPGGTRPAQPKTPAAPARAKPAQPKAGPASRPGKAPAPAAARPAQAAARPVEQPPFSVRTAVKLMYAGAVLSLIDLIVTLATAGQLRHLIHVAKPGLSAAKLDGAVHAQIASSIAIWLITIGFWVVMARTNQAGRGWARTVATVLCALSTFSFVEALLQPASLLSKLFFAPLWLVGVAATVLLWRPDTSDYIRAGRD